MPNVKNRSQFEAFTRESLEPILFCNNEGHITMWNRGCEYLLGYKLNEIREYTLFSLVDNHCFDSFATMFEVLKKNRTITFETCLNNKGGGTMEVEMTAGPLDEGFYFVLHDLARKKNMETRIKRLSMLPDNNPDFVMEWDRFNGIIYKNQAVKNFTTDKNLAPDSLFRILPDNFQNHMRRLVGTDRNLNDVEARYDDRVFSYTFTPYRADMDRVLIVGKDVTAKKSLEEEMDFAYDRTQQILDFIESTLQELRYIDLDEEIDFTSVTKQALRDMTDQVSMYPTHIFIGLENDERLLEGYVVAKRHGQQEVVSEKIIIHPRDLQNVVSDRGKTRFANWYDEYPSMSSFQSIFPEDLRKYLPEVINYASYRIAGEKRGVLIAFNHPKDVNLYDGETIKGLSVAIGTLISIQSQFREKEQAQFLVFTKMAEMAERRDQETGEHLKRMRNYARLIAEELSRRPQYEKIIDHDYIRRIFNSSPLHDIGKVGIPDAILQKPGKLDDVEYEKMQKHTIIGGQVLEGPKFLDMARQVAYYHHEKYDGSGYPFGLSGEDIPLCARIVAIADVYDAMTSKRVYKEAFSHERTKKLLSICSGGHFAPDVVEAFLSREQDFLRIKEMYKD